MLHIRKPYLRNRMATLAFSLFNKLENNGNSDFATNGEEQFLEDLLSLYSGHSAILFDVGGCTGKWSKLALDKAERFDTRVQIHIFEPVGSSYNELKKSFKNDSNVILNNFAISDKNGVVDIFYSDKKREWASLYKRNLRPLKLNLSRKEVVKSKTLEDYIKKSGVNHIDLLKLDIEGHELSALKGLGNYLDSRFISAIQFEYGGAYLQSAASLVDLFDLLENADFSIYKIMPDYLEPRLYEYYMENYQYANYVALSRKVQTL